MSDNNYFTELAAVNVNDKVEKKNGLSYLSWAWAWQELKQRHPDANYTIYENQNGWNYHTDGRTAWVKVGVTVNGVEHVEELPIMDYKNKSIDLDHITSFEVNKSIQRALTKAVARHGLGLYIYAGEDLPSETDGKTATTTKTTKTAAKPDDKKTDGDSWRDKLRTLLEKNYIDPQTIIKACGLKKTSSEDEWHAAYDYAKKNYCA